MSFGNFLYGATGGLMGDKKDKNTSNEGYVAPAPAPTPDQIAEGNKNAAMGNYLSNPGGGFTLGGTPQEQSEQATSLSQVGTMTGQNVFDVGNMNKDYLDNLQKRRAGEDRVAQYMMDQRNRNTAAMGRSMAGRGIAGGVAGSAMAQAQREADSAINAQLQNRQDNMEAEYRKYINRMQSLKGEALAQGGQRGAAQNLKIEAGEGLTLICTELKRQNLLPTYTHKADYDFGVMMTYNYPTVMKGYHVLAKPIVFKMQLSSKFTKVVAALAIPWAKHIAGNKNLVGALVMLLGIPLCAVVGYFSKGENYVQAN
jgi:hypothetical protein